MSPDDRQSDIEQKMDEAFAAGPGSKEEQDLLNFLTQHREYQALWQEYQTLRRGMEALQNTATPSELTRARIRHVARERLKTFPKAKRGWRWLLSQPVVAAATVLLVVGFGIYSQYLLREERKLEQKIPAATEKEAPPASAPAPVAPEIPAPPAIAKPLPKPTASQTPAGAAGSGLIEPLEERERAADSAAEPAQAVTPEVKAQRLAPPSRYELLLSQAKEKIAAQDCPGAMKLLKEAQQLQDTAELRDLLKKCDKK